MPRANRGDEAGRVHHAVNRGNARQRVFHDDADHRAFLDLLGPACDRHPPRVPAACLMPDHVHPVPWPREAGQARRFMQWLFTSHVRRHHRRHPGRGGGHVWQGRFESFPVQPEPGAPHAVARHVERNPLRAGLVADYIGIAGELKQALKTYTESRGKGQPTVRAEDAHALLSPAGTGSDLTNRPAARRGTFPAASPPSRSRFAASAGCGGRCRSGRRGPRALR